LGTKDNNEKDWDRDAKTDTRDLLAMQAEAAEIRRLGRQFPLLFKSFLARNELVAAGFG
jgi:hypothetical protein